MAAFADERPGGIATGNGGDPARPDGQPPAPGADAAAAGEPDVEAAAGEPDGGAAAGEPDGGAPQGQAPATPDRPEPEAAAPLGDLVGRLGKIEEQLAEFHRRAAHREAVIDRLHQENQRLSEGLGRAFLEPVIADLIRLHDQLSREVRRLAADGEDARLLWSFAEDVAQILDRCGVAAFSAEPGDPFERGRHRALAVVACDDESRHNTVAEVVAVGFADRETGRVRRPVHARVFQHSASPGTAGQAPSTARSR